MLDQRTDLAIREQGCEGWHTGATREDVPAGGDAVVEGVVRPLGHRSRIRMPGRLDRKTGSVPAIALTRRTVACSAVASVQCGTIVLLSGAKRARRPWGCRSCLCACRLLVYVPSQSVGVSARHRLVWHDRAGDGGRVVDDRPDVVELGAVGDAVQHGPDRTTVSGDDMTATTRDAALEKPLRSLDLER